MSNFSELSTTQLDRVVKSQDIVVTRNLRLSAEIVTLELRKWCVEQAVKIMQIPSCAGDMASDFPDLLRSIYTFVTEGEQQ